MTNFRYFASQVALWLCAIAILAFATDLNSQSVSIFSSGSGSTNVLEQAAGLRARAAVGAAQLRATTQSTPTIQSTNIISAPGGGEIVLEASQLSATKLPSLLDSGVSGSASMQSLSANDHILNINFGDNTKIGFAAIGQNANDYWNSYMLPGYWLGTLQNLQWSDQTASGVAVTVADAPGQWGNGFCIDPMYASFIYRSDNSHSTVILTNLPTDTYDFYVYATRASEIGVPVIELQVNGVSYQIKGTSLWGNDWYSSYWDEGEQYVRFRNVPVNNQSVTFDLYPDAVGYTSISGLQIVPSSAAPSEQPMITALMNVNFGSAAGTKTGPAAVGIDVSDFWNGYYFPGQHAATLQNLQWSDQGVSGAGLTVRNAPGSWGVPGLDPMLFTFLYAWDNGNSTVTITNLPAGDCNVYIYSPQTDAGHNSIYELWSDDVHQGTKGTTLYGYDYFNAPWEPCIQYVLFRDVTVSSDKPLVIHVKHGGDGYQYISGLQIAYTSSVVDSDGDGLPDAWEMRWFGDLSQTAGGDPDGDGLNNLREYQLALDPNRADSNSNGISDLYDFEEVWVEDATPQGGYEDALSESWNWTGSWYDGDGWEGQTIYPHSGRSWSPGPFMHVSDYVPGDRHEHYFWSSVATMRPVVGDILYAYVNLDPTHPPSEVMLQWYVVDENGNGSWEHRAYWGSDLIGDGTNGTESRHPMGALSSAGQWVRLEVPASSVGLEGKIVEGMAYTLFDGRAAWDSAGIVKVDHDGDGLPDYWEMQHFGNLSQNATSDLDGDGLTTLEEYQRGTNPNNQDSDGDHLSDRDEIYIYGTSPIAIDTDGDGHTDWQEVYDGTRPLNASDYATWPVVADQPDPDGGPRSLGPVLIAWKEGAESYFTVKNGDPNIFYTVSGSVDPAGPYNTFMGFVKVGGRYRLVNPGYSSYNYRLDLQGYKDHDGDGLATLAEAAFGTTATSPESSWRTDTDSDGLPDSYESMIGLNPNTAEAAPVLPTYNKCPLP